MGKRFKRLDFEMDEIDRRVRVMTLSTKELKRAKAALNSSLFVQAEQWADAIDAELDRRESQAKDAVCNSAAVFTFSTARSI